MSYTPIWTSISDVKTKLKPRADDLTDADILLAIEQGENETENWFESCNRDSANLTSEEVKAARWIALVKSCRFLVSALPMDTDEKRQLHEDLREEEEQLLQGLMFRLYNIKTSGKGIYKRIPVEEEDFYE